MGGKAEGSAAGGKKRGGGEPPPPPKKKAKSGGAAPAAKKKKAKGGGAGGERAERGRLKAEQGPGTSAARALSPPIRGVPRAPRSAAAAPGGGRGAAAARYLALTGGGGAGAGDRGAPAPRPDVGMGDDEGDALFERVLASVRACGEAARRVAEAVEAMDAHDPGKVICCNKDVWPPGDWNRFVDDLTPVLPRSRVRDVARLRLLEAAVRPPAPPPRSRAEIEADPLWEWHRSLRSHIEKCLLGGETPEEVRVYGTGDWGCEGRGSCVWPSAGAIALNSCLGQVALSARRWQIPQDLAEASGLGPLFGLLRDHPLPQVRKPAQTCAKLPTWKGLSRACSQAGGILKTWEDTEAEVRAAVARLVSRVAAEVEAGGALPGGAGVPPAAGPPPGAARPGASGPPA